VERLPHGHTNRTRRIGHAIEKRYEGADRSVRAERELSSLSGLSGHFPVPEVVRFDESIPMLVLADVPGRHGQALIDQGYSSTVLRLLGISLAALQGLDPALVHGLNGSGDVIVHGDFGPQNTLISLDLIGVSAVLDWELAHMGSPVEDLAWTEWIVRTHHAGSQGDLAELFAGYGRDISWSARQSSMVQQCRQYVSYCEESGWETAAAEWRRRTQATERWHE
jgi:tRNA A-37 threonylcarbamoyl transferase component Bud32